MSRERKFIVPVIYNEILFDAIYFYLDNLIDKKDTDYLTESTYLDHVLGWCERNKDKGDLTLIWDEIYYTKNALQVVIDSLTNTEKEEPQKPSNVEDIEAWLTKVKELHIVIESYQPK